MLPLFSTNATASRLNSSVYDFLVVDISHLHNELFHNRVLNFLSSFSGKDQEAIAEALSDADALSESLEQLIAKKRHLKQGAM